MLDKMRAASAIIKAEAERRGRPDERPDAMLGWSVRCFYCNKSIPLTENDLDEDGHILVSSRVCANCHW